MSRSSKRLFLKKFITQPSINASVIPSSQALARLVVQDVDWSVMDTIIEFGPGTGVFTEHIVAHMKSWARLVVLEFDADYCRLLTDKFGDKITIAHGNVQDFAQILIDYKLKPDLIISALPHYPFLGERWISAIKAIKKVIDAWCIMRSVTYAPWAFKKTYQPLHPTFLGYTLMCIPPTFVYEMKK
jgi:phospholipid N-methyltransferase